MESTSNAVETNQAQVLLTPLEEQFRSYLQALGHKDTNPASYKWAVSYFDPSTLLRERASKLDFEECQRQILEDKQINFCLANGAEKDWQWQLFGQPHRISPISKNKVSPPEKPKLKSRPKQQTKSQPQKQTKGQSKTQAVSSIDLVQVLQNEVYPALSRDVRENGNSD